MFCLQMLQMSKRNDGNKNISCSPETSNHFYSPQAIVASYAIVLEADAKDVHSPAIAASSSLVWLVVASIIFLLSFSA